MIERNDYLAWIAVIALACGFVQSAHARAHAVKDDAELAAALRSAGPGEIITLEPGEYAPNIRDFHGSATIASADASNPAVLTSLIVRSSSGLSIVGVTFSTEKSTAASSGTAGVTPFQIGGSSNITLAKLDVHGSTSGSLETDESGIMIRGSDHVTVSDSNFHNLHFAIAHLDDQFLTLKNNDFHDLRDDAMRGGGSSNVLIENNHCHDNHPDGDRDKDHPDCIQFWTTNTATSAHDIVISGNRYERGRGHATQFIFMGNEKHIRYEHIVIKDNVALGPAWNAVAVGFAHDVTVTNNRLTSLCAPESGRTLVAWIATQDVDGLVMRDNVAGSYLDRGGDTNVRAAHNATRGCIR